MTNSKKKKLLFTDKQFIFGVCAVFFVCLFIMIYTVSRPSEFFPLKDDIQIVSNTSLSVIAENLANNHVISSPFLFKVAVVIFGGQRGLFAGDYRFVEPQGLFKVAYRMVKGIQGLPKIKITIPEGTNSYDMAYIYMKSLPNFNAPKFLGLALQNEGYLFPDTYLFLSNTKPEAIIKEMRANFLKHIKSLNDEISKFNKPLSDIIIMASIIEEEARGIEDRRMVSGVLWKRMEKGMLLQVDAPFYYISGKSTAVLYKDLEVDSPYNTYKYKGLPKGPISNPGLEAIRATVTPLYSPYLFYLTGKDGEMKYSVTYDGHLANKDKYLK
jgi:UPF0755 protein